jgi:outer membrane receptor protein involved in Fe transport
MIVSHTAVFAATILGTSPAIHSISGTVVDARTGEPLIGVSVRIDGTVLGAATDLDGRFVIRNIAPGVVSLTISSVGYAATRISEVTVGDSSIAGLQVLLHPQAYEQGEVKVTAKRLMSGDGALLKHRQAALAVSDAIGAEAISRSGGGDAAQAMSRVTGASVVGGKYVYVRGLGERYSNTLINGSQAPTADPDKQAVNMDLVPAGLLDNIIVEKTFTPDKPGNFSGGSVNLTTKDTPDRRYLSFGSSVTYNSQVTFSDDVLYYPGGSQDWLGQDDGGRAIPDYLLDPNLDIPTPTEARRDTSKALFLDKMAHDLNSGMQPRRHTAPVNKNFALTYGDKLAMLGRTLGIMASVSYTRGYEYYGDGTKGTWRYLSSQPDSLDPLYLYSDARGKEEVLWGGLASATYHLQSNHKLGLSYMYNRSGEASARYLEGFSFALGSPNATYRTRSIDYVERSMHSFTLKGDHARLPFGMKAEWQLSASTADQDEPDIRRFADTRDLSIDGEDTTVYYGLYPPYPSHYWRSLNESNREVRLDLTYGFNQWNGLASKLKFGGMYLHKTRDFRETQFTMFQQAPTYWGDPDAFLDENNIGMVYDSTPDPTIDLGVNWDRFSNPNSNYDATQNIAAAYGMIQLPITTPLSLVGGVRYEATKMSMDRIYLGGVDAAGRPKDTTELIDGAELLPSVNLIYRLSDEINLRSAYGRTLARPTFRELSRFASEDFSGDVIFNGNPNLEYTTIDNYDLRFEWFDKPGDIVAVSGFYKRFHNPIERVFIGEYDIQYQNVPRAELIGIEFEARKDLGFLHPALRNVRLGGNFTLIKSTVDRSERELTEKRVANPDVSSTRPMAGQSPYLVNVDIGFASRKSGTAVTALVNVFGKRLDLVTRNVLPEVYELARTSIDFTASQRVLGGLKFKASARNLTNDKIERTIEYNGAQYAFDTHSVGRSFSFGLSYEL